MQNARIPLGGGGVPECTQPHALGMHRPGLQQLLLEPGAGTSTADSAGESVVSP